MDLLRAHGARRFEHVLPRHLREPLVPHVAPPGPWPCRKYRHLRHLCHLLLLLILTEAFSNVKGLSCRVSFYMDPLFRPSTVYKVAAGYSVRKVGRKCESCPATPESTTQSSGRARANASTDVSNVKLRS